MMLGLGLEQHQRGGGAAPDGVLLADNGDFLTADNGDYLTF